jgi:peptide/nickel transport system permease protein
MERLPASMELNIAVLLISIMLGVAIGVLAAIWRGRAFDQATRVLAVIGDAVPSFWLSFIVILVFASPGLGWLPMGDRCAYVRGGGCPPVFERLDYLILPTVVLALGGISVWSRYLRAAMLENINSDYIRTAKAKGLPARTVWFKHALRNALIPMATFIGPAFVGLLGGAVIIEQIFNWPGIGRLTLTALKQQDYPIIMASVVISSILTIIAYLISDILYAIFDPRIRL